MSYAIAAAGTGGHVYPGLAVGESLVASGIPAGEVLFIGGGRLESNVFPAHGFPFLPVELQGLRRSLSPSNLRLPAVILRAVREVSAELRSRRVGAVLAMGSYVSVPVGLAARRTDTPFFLHEQNADAGLANRVMGRIARRTFTSFADTKGAVRPQHVGNPIRQSLATFSRPHLRQTAFERYGLEPGRVTVGVVGGSLGARAINEAVLSAFSGWDGAPIQVVHLTGRDHAEAVAAAAEGATFPWVVRGFEPEMPLFFAVCDMVIARAGGMVAEITATHTPAILIPGGFGSGGHQKANARAVAAAGAAVVLGEDRLPEIGLHVAELAEDPERRRRMSDAAAALARPEAAAIIAEELRRAHG